MKCLQIRSAMIVFALGLLAPSAMAQTGIFADFNTSMGSFTCKLYYARAPKATANFIGLATGARPWVDLPTGQYRTNEFYNGTKFHRVISNFMIQGGSPNGQGTDGPGYAFQDEFDPTLRHDQGGVLSMANSGPNSNGAQFFVTVTNTPWLDDVHTIFGKVVGGMDVVNAINHVATNTNDVPVTDVIIQSILIRRLGTDAEAFDINQQNLPVVSTVPLRITLGEDEVAVRFTNSLYAENWVSESTNLTTWFGSSLGVDLAEPVLKRIKSLTDVTARFFTMTRVQYPSSTFAPRDLYNRTLTLNFEGGLGTITVNFDGSGGGAYDYSGSPGTITNYSWGPEIYRGYLWPIEYSELVPMTLRLDFTSETGGTFEGTAYAGTPFGVAGTFTLTGP